MDIFVRRASHASPSCAFRRRFWVSVFLTSSLAICKSFFRIESSSTVSAFVFISRTTTAFSNALDRMRSSTPIRLCSTRSVCSRQST